MMNNATSFIINLTTPFTVTFLQVICFTVTVLIITLPTYLYGDDIDMFYVENIPTACEKTLTSDSQFDYLKDIQTAIFNDTVSFSNSPVSVNNSNQRHHNDVLYYTLFTPNKFTTWLGNLKSYKLSNNGDVLDKNNNVAINPSTGLIVDTAQSYWSDDIDGAKVTNGGVVARLNNVSRNIYVNHQSSLIKLNKTDNPTLTDDDFDLTKNPPAPKNTKQDYINWMLTQSTIADPLHSPPVEVTYSGSSSVIFFGDNQGYIHAIDEKSGDELWAFIPKELLKQQPSIRAPSLVYSSQNSILEKALHIYGMDGKIVTWTTNGRKYIASGMRRGGSSYYALDVTDRLTPTLQWQISSIQSDFSNLGQTWSTPIKTTIKIGKELKSVLIFGGGYDPQQDTVTTRTKDQQGDSLYIIEATSGHIIFKKDNLGYSIPSDIKAIDIDGDHAADQLYVGDMGGRVLRFDITDTTLAFNIVADIADDGQINNRRFYHAPDISRLTNSALINTASPMLGIAIGSGYHARPNNTQTSDNFYLFKVPLTLANTITTIKKSDLLLATIQTENDFTANNASWYLPLNTHGEKVLSSSLTVNNVIWFTTFKPSVVTNQCIIKQGTSRLYRINILDGTPTYTKATTDIIDGQIDTSKDCSNTTCNADDRYIELPSVSLPLSPINLNISNEKEDSNMICVGTYCLEQAKRTSQITFWRQLQ